MSAKDAVSKIEAGADVVQIYTGLIYEASCTGRAGRQGHQGLTDQTLKLAVQWWVWKTRCMRIAGRNTGLASAAGALSAISAKAQYPRQRDAGPAHEAAGAGAIAAPANATTAAGCCLANATAQHE